MRHAAPPQTHWCTLREAIGGGAPQGMIPARRQIHPVAPDRNAVHSGSTREKRTRGWILDEKLKMENLKPRVQVRGEGTEGRRQRERIEKGERRKGKGEERERERRRKREGIHGRPRRKKPAATCRGDWWTSRLQPAQSQWGQESTMVSIRRRGEKFTCSTAVPPRFMCF